MTLRYALPLIPAIALLAACGGGEQANNEVNAVNYAEPVTNEFVPTNEVIDNNMVDNNVVDNNTVDNNTVNAY